MENKINLAILSALATLAAPSRAWLIARTAGMDESEGIEALAALVQAGQVAVIPATQLEGGGEYYACA
jgi:Kef-type K+ transport system membrane component KefB